VSVFGREYAGAYDALYGEKNYQAECDMIEGLIAESNTISPVRRLLDLGCGTGSHAVRMACRGYSVSGIDLFSAMLEIARAKAIEAGVEHATDFHQGDIRTVRLGGQPYDAAIMMFAVLGYQRTDEDVRAALRTAREHLARGATLVFDVWHGPGVMADKPGPRERRIDQADGEVVRRTESVLDEAAHVCTVKFHLEVWRGGKLIESTREDHAMRFYFPDELRDFARECGFVCASIRRFPEWQKPADETAWNVVAALRAT